VRQLYHRRGGLLQHRLGGEHFGAKSLEMLVACSGQPVTVEFTGRKREREIPDTRCDFGKARKLLGWEPRIRLEDGIRALVQQFIRRRNALHSDPAPVGVTPNGARRPSGKVKILWLLREQFLRSRVVIGPSKSSHRQSVGNAQNALAAFPTNRRTRVGKSR